MNNYQFTIPENVTKAIDRLSVYGFFSYVVGGAVRDLILGKTPTDWDLTTNAKPNEILDVFKDFTTIETGMAHGTVTVLMDKEKSGGSILEITTFRKDGEYDDHRRPTSVTFSDTIEEDLSRRDFTINSLAYNPKTGVIDIFDGINDIHKKIIATVGNAEKRFDEDALRMIRGIRFSSTLGFQIEASTKKQIHLQKDLLNFVAKERILVELKKIILGDNVVNIINEYQDVFFVVIPQLSISPNDIIFLDLLPKIFPLRMAVILQNSFIYRDILDQLKLDNATKNFILWLISMKNQEVNWDEISLKRLLSTNEVDYVESLIYFKNFQKKDTANSVDDALAILNKIVTEQQCYRLKDLAIGGQDLMEIGIPADKNLGKILLALLNLVIEGEENSPTNLKNMAKEIFTSLQDQN